MRQPATCLILLCACTSLRVAAAAEPIDVGSRAQLFIDDRFIAESEGVKLAINPPVKCEAILRNDKPWESRFMGFYMSVIQDGPLTRMWYMARSDEEKSGPWWCYAESRDGVHWIKPDLGLVEFHGSKQNNIVMTGTNETTFFLDPAAPPESRYKAVAVMHWPDPQRAGIYIHTSPDGIHWTFSTKRVLPFAPDSGNQVFYDARLKKYVAYIRVWDRMRKVGRVEMDDVTKPWPYDAQVEPRHLWGREKIPVPSREVPVVLGYDDRDPPRSDHYNAAAVQYAPDCYLMFPSPYRHFPPPPKGTHHNHGLLDIQIATSRDGVNWNRLSRAPYVPLGLEGAADSSTLYMAIGMIRRADHIDQYYCGFRNAHGTIGQAKVDGTIFRLEQRLDGFVAAEAEYDGGRLTTPPLVFRGNRLTLNIDCSALGTCEVAILDAQGAPIPGFSAADCELIGGNTLAAPVAWKGNSDLSALAGRPIRLHFEMRACKLFAFQFAP